MLTVESRTEKTTKIRHIPLNEISHEALKATHERSTATSLDDPVFVNHFGKPLRSIRGRFERARKRAGLDARLPNRKHEVTIHIMRHTFASRLVMAGIDPRTIQQLGGWCSLAMLQRYSHLSPGHLQDALDSIAEKKSHQNSQHYGSTQRKA